MPGPPGFPAQAVLGSSELGCGDLETEPPNRDKLTLGAVRDENLKKLLMSWYYAGYYTGLFEGQQQAQQPQT